MTKRRVSIKESVTSTGTVYKTSITKKHEQAELEEYKAEYSIDEHVIPIFELERKYETSVVKGLTQIKADELLMSEGPNILPTPAMKSKWLILLEFLFCGFQTILWIAALMSFVIYGINVSHGMHHAKDQMYFGIVIVIVIMVTGLFGFYQEASNVAIIDSFKKLTPKSATVIRDGQSKVIPSEEVVRGDLVELKAGEWIPADIRVTKANHLKVDNSAITGESLAQTRNTTCTDKNALETTNMVFFSTCVVEGSGRGIVVRRGEKSLMGRIAELTSALEKGTTPIHKEITYFIKFITILSFAIAFTFFIICMIYGYAFYTSFVFFIALVIANVPEGLPVTLTACMTLTSKRMASKNCLVKKLEAIETLGCCNVICSDKTGTLTQNKMKVVHLYYDTQTYYILVDPTALNRTSPSLEALCNVGILCSQASFIEKKNIFVTPIDEWPTIGDASESAVLKCMYILFEEQLQKRREDFPKVYEIPFNSTNKYQLSIHSNKSNDGYQLLMKGAPERILDKCATIIRFGETKPFADDTRKGIKKAVNMLGMRGERVLAFADLELPASTYGPNYPFDHEKYNFPLTGLRFVGLMSMIDPPRASVPDAVAKCKTAGIRVIMVTGDHPLTAAAIAKQVGILSPTSVTAYDIAMRRDISVSLVAVKDLASCNAAVITGNDLREMSDHELRDCIRRYNEIVFARTSPQQKLKIVEAFQFLGNVVAVTGDGVNDSPALKKGDIGVAMGITGSDVSKDAADMILLDDNFSSIVTGIEEGRLIFDNLKKSIAYLLTSNVPEITPFIVMVIWNVPKLISVLAILVIDVGTDLWPAISLAYERAEADIMLRRPRDPNYDKLVNYRLILLTYCQIGVIQACASFASCVLVMYSHGFYWKELFGMSVKWEDEDALIADSYNQSWNFTERSILTRKCYSGFFLSIVMTQIADLLICKTRKLSLFQQGMTNWVLNFGLMFELLLAASVVYVPGLNQVLQFDSIPPWMFLIPSAPFAFIIVAYDETRKFLIRRFPGGIFDKETYY